MTETKNAAQPGPTAGPGAAMGHQPQQQFITTGTPVAAHKDEAPAKPLDETVAGGVYLDGKTLKPHDAHGNALDAESLKAAGIDLSGKKDKDKPTRPPYTESEWSLERGGPAAVPQAPGDEKEPEEKEPEPAVDPGAVGRPTKAGADAGQKAEAEAEKAKKEQEKEKEKASSASSAKK
jgi:hypothetical protein